MLHGNGIGYVEAKVYRGANARFKKKIEAYTYWKCIFPNIIALIVFLYFIQFNNFSNYIILIIHHIINYIIIVIIMQIFIY